VSISTGLTECLYILIIIFCKRIDVYYRMRELINHTYSLICFCMKHLYPNHYYFCLCYILCLTNFEGSNTLCFCMWVCVVFLFFFFSDSLSLRWWHSCSLCVPFANSNTLFFTVPHLISPKCRRIASQTWWVLVYNLIFLFSLPDLRCFFQVFFTIFLSVLIYLVQCKLVAGSSNSYRPLFTIQTL
jgi:hypothetical protein